MQTTSVLSRTEKNVTPIRLDPEWNNARELLAQGRACAAELATEIERLRSAYLGKGHGGARSGASFTNVKLESGQGFVAQLRDQLGLHPQQAARIEQAAAYLFRIGQVADAEDGEVIEWQEKGETRTLTVTPAHREQARQALNAMALPGAPKPSRAWAGVMGEGTRVGEYGAGSKDRAAPDDLGLWVKACACLRRIGDHWQKSFPAGSGHQVRAISELTSSLAALPAHIREEVVAAATDLAASRSK